MADRRVVSDRRTTRDRVISDFRVRDMAAGGQGAPLVPMADAMLFSATKNWRGLQNLGGIGNVSVVPPGGDIRGVRAFDTGPGCGVIDKVVRKLRPDLALRRRRKAGVAGKPGEPVVDKLLCTTIFRADPPKSTGPELFSPAYADEIIAACRADAPGCTDEDIVATAVSLTARSIADAYDRFIAEPVSEIFLSGGGAKNPALVTAIAAAVAPRTVSRFRPKLLRRGGKGGRGLCIAWISAPGRPAGECAHRHRRFGPKDSGKAHSGIEETE